MFSHFNIAYSEDLIDANKFLNNLTAFLPKNKSLVFDSIVLVSVEAENIRDFLKKHTLKNSPDEIKVLLLNFFSISKHGQNSLLKYCEEPPPGTLIFFIIPHSIRILPTIKSRANFIDLKKYNFETLLEKDKISPENFLSASHAKRLEMYNKIKDLDSAERKKIIEKLLFRIKQIAEFRSIALPREYWLRLPELSKQMSLSSSNTKIVFEEICIMLPVLAVS